MNDWTLTLDVKLDELPKEALALLRTQPEAERQTEGECFIYPDGGVGIYGETGVKEAQVKAKKWTRIVITMSGDFGVGLSPHITSHHITSPPQYL